MRARLLLYSIRCFRRVLGEGPPAGAGAGAVAWPVLGEAGAAMVIRPSPLVTSPSPLATGASPLVTCASALVASPSPGAGARGNLFEGGTSGPPRGVEAHHGRAPALSCDLP